MLSIVQIAGKTVGDTNSKLLLARTRDAATGSSLGVPLHNSCVLFPRTVLYSTLRNIHGYEFSSALAV